MAALKLLTTSQVAAKLGYTSVHVIRLTKEGKLKAYAVLENGHLLFTQEQIDASGILPKPRKQQS